ncbi:Protein OS9-like [Trypanosoma melophagium]|uniref:Protein OS9-like n=1 Tax=Trypanosoma melophagium TaxID=715481 RepID=UPI00351A805B|nr:Protein OS9-like [Trypanosoma melophagium]
MGTTRVVWDNNDRVRDMRYSVIFTHTRIPADNNTIPPSQYYPMKLRNGSSYLCILPDMPPKQQQEEEKNRDNNAHHRNSVMQSFEPNSLLPPHTAAELHIAFRNWCYGKQEEWWTYQLCWNERIVQFHIQMVMGNGDAHVSIVSTAPQSHFLLGLSPPNAAGVELRYGMDPSGERYIYTNYNNGDVCDLTRLPRSTEVRLYCAADDEREKLQVVEAAVCRYVASVTSPRACVRELRRQIVQSEIRCYDDGGN